MMKTRLSYILLLLTAFVINLFIPNPAITVLMWTLVGLAVVSFVIVLLLMRKVDVKAKVDNTAVIQGEQASVVRLEINNEFFFGSPAVKLYFKARNMYCNTTTYECLIFPLTYRDVTKIKIPIFFEHCGKNVITIEKMEVCDILGVFSKSRIIRQPFTVAVLPVEIPLEQAPDVLEGRDLSSNEFSDYISGDDHSEVFDHHVYREGDNIKNINWKLSARIETMMINEFSLPICSSVAVIVEFTPNNLTLLDYDIAALNSVSSWLHSKGFTHDIIWYCEDGGLEMVKMDSLSVFEDERFNLVDCLYETKPIGGNLSLEVYLSSVINAEINTIYITQSLDDNVADKLIEFSSRTKISVVYVNQIEPVLPQILAKLKENDIVVI